MENKTPFTHRLFSPQTHHRQQHSVGIKKKLSGFSKETVWTGLFAYAVSFSNAQFMGGE